MKEITLYSNLFSEESGSQLNGFTSTEIFSKGGSDEVWGNSEEICNPFSFSSLDASNNYIEDQLDTLKSKTDIENINISIDIKEILINDKRNIERNSIHIKSEIPPVCEWVGMGIGWDGWQGKNLISIMDNSAIEFMARVDGNAIYSIPLVFILEDYSANQCYATANYLGIEGGEITSKWTKIIIPLSTFSYQKDNIDLSNVKQLLIQCYDKIDIYLDNIKIIPYSHEFRKTPSNLTVKEKNLPINIFTDNLESSFGINEDYCLNILLNNDKEYPDGSFIDVNIEMNSCNWNKLGISWSNWLYTDLSENIYGVFLEFDINIINNLNSIVSFEDYNGKKTSLNISKYLDKKRSQEWQKIRIPIKDFPIRKSNVDFKKIKNLLFVFSDNTKLKIDNIKLTN